MVNTFQQEKVRRAETFIERHLGWIEDILQVKAKVVVLPVIKEEHLMGCRPNELEGIFHVEEEQIFIYPVNIWLNHCGLLKPEEGSDEIFEGEVVGVLAHEMKHLSQCKRGLFAEDIFCEDRIEKEAYAFGHEMKCRFYHEKEKESKKQKS